MNLAQQAWEQSNIGRLRTLLERQRPEPGQEDLRGFEWYYWWRAAHLDVASIAGTQGAPFAQLAISPDGKIVADASLHQQLGGWKRHIGRISVVVHPGYRGRGLARALVQELIDIASDAGLEKLEAEWNERAKADRHFKQLAHPINFNPGIIKGGDWASSVPAWCDVDCRIAILPGWSVADCQNEILACVSAAARDHRFLSNNPPEVQWSGFLSEGYELTDSAAPEAAFGKAYASVYGGAVPDRAFTALTDTRFYGLNYSIPSLCFGASGAAMHGFNEYVELDSLRKSTKATALFIAEWCGVEAL